MIDPAKLTEENGFVDGCVVEILHRHSDGDFFVTGKILRTNSRGIVLDMPISAKNGVTVLFSDIISIRPLTGPMAIWNFAPKENKDQGVKAPVAVLYSGLDVMWLYDDEDPNEFLNDNCIMRPFWARSEK